MTQLFDVALVDSFGLGGHFKILGESLIEPEGHVFEHAVEESVSQLVAEVFLDAVPPVGVNEKLFRSADPWLGDEERSPLGQVRVFGPHEVFVSIPVLEEINVHERVGAGKLELLVHLITKACEFTKEGRTAVQLEVGKKYVL